MTDSDAQPDPWGDPIGSDAFSSTPLLILAHTNTWQAALKRVISQRRSVWALDENDLVAEAISHPSSAIVIEISSSSVDRFVKLQPLFWPRRQIFVVGDRQIRSAEKSLRSLGIVEVFYASADLQRLVRMVDIHNRLFPGPPVDLETEIEQRLPWS